MDEVSVTDISDATVIVQDDDVDSDIIVLYPVCTASTHQVCQCKMLMLK